MYNYRKLFLEITLIKTAQIDQSFPYCYHFQIENPALVESVKETGIVYPIILVFDKKYFVVDGHRRLIAAVSAGLKEVPAFVYDLKQIEATFFMGLQVNLNSGDLTAIEKLKAYEIARERFSESGQEKIKQLLGIDRLSYLELIAGSILKLPHLTQHYLHRQNFSMKALHQLISYNLSEFGEWFSMADELNLKGSELLNILEQVQDISLRDRLKLQTLLVDTKLKGILESGRTPQQKVQALKLFVFQKRFPLLNRMQTNIQTIQKELEKLLGSDVQILWDRTLENPGALLQINLKEEQQLSKMLTELQRPEVQDKIKKLLDKQNQLPEDV
jgi:ParB/RepB/Spo0J family partition protein